MMGNWVEWKEFDVKVLGLKLKVTRTVKDAEAVRGKTSNRSGACAKPGDTLLLGSQELYERSKKSVAAVENLKMTARRLERQKRTANKKILAQTLLYYRLKIPKDVAGALSRAVKSITHAFSSVASSLRRVFTLFRRGSDNDGGNG